MLVEGVAQGAALPHQESMEQQGGKIGGDRSTCVQALWGDNEEEGH